MKNTCIRVLALLVLTNFSAQAAEKGCDDEARYPMISKAELQSVVQAKTAFIVDVNSETSFKETHVPGAVHFGANQKNFAKILPTDKNALIVSYCGGPQCNAWKKAATEACKQGYTNIRHFKEGISGWKKSS